MIRGINGARVFPVRFEGRRIDAEHRRQQHGSRERFAERRRGRMERKAAAGGEADQNKLRIRVPAAHRGDEIRKVVVKLAGIVDVAAPSGGAVAADVGGVKRNTFGAKRFAERVQAHALRRRAVDGDDDQRRIGRRGASRQTRNVIGVPSRAGVVSSRRQIAEIYVPEWRAERGERHRRVAGAEREHAGKRRDDRDQ